MLLPAALVSSELGMCCVRSGAAVNPPVALELQGGDGTSWNCLVTEEQSRSKAEQPQAFNNPHPEAIGTPGCWKLGIVWSFFFCVGVDAPASSWPRGFVNKPTVNRGISNMCVYFQNLTLDFTSSLSSKPAQFPMFQWLGVVCGELFPCVLNL